MTLLKRGLKYGILGTINAKNIRKNIAFHRPTGAIALPWRHPWASSWLRSFVHSSYNSAFRLIFALERVQPVSCYFGDADDVGLVGCIQ